MRNIRFIFITALIVFLDVAVTPNICSKPSYLVEYDVQVANFTENQKLEFIYGRNRYIVESNQTLSENIVHSQIEATISNGYYCEIIEEEFVLKDINITNIEIVDISNSDRTISFPYQLNKSYFTKSNEKYIFKIDVIVELEYETVS